MTYAAGSRAPADPAQPVDPARAGLRRQRGRLALTICVWLVAAIGVAALIISMVVTEVPGGVSLSLFYALVPLPLLWLAYWWLDRYEPKPLRYLFAAFVWGAVVAVLVSIALEVFVGKTFDLSDGQQGALIAPAVEEPAKGSFLLITFLRSRRVIRQIMDGIVLAGLVGIGFAFTENILYYVASYLQWSTLGAQGAATTTLTFIVRGIFSPFAHPLFTTTFGIGVGLAAMKRSWLLKIALGAVGMAASMVLHGLWNGSIAYGGPEGFLLMYLGMLGVLLLLGGYAIWLRLRQGRTIEVSLNYVARRGWIHPDEIPYIARFNLRNTARKYAKTNYGGSAAKAVSKYQRYATEMGFMHDRVMRGQSTARGVETTRALLAEMAGLRPDVRLPPPLRGPHRW